jgi:hypothetical protein
MLYFAPFDLRLRQNDKGEHVIEQCGTVMAAGGGGFRIDGEDFVDRLSEVFEFGQLELGAGFFEDAVDDFLGRHGFSL